MKYLFLILFTILPYIVLSQTKEKDTFVIVDTTTKVSENPGMTVLNRWSTAIPNEAVVSRINQENEYHEKQMLYNDIEEAFYVVIPLILLVVAIIFIRKILK